MHNEQWTYFQRRFQWRLCTLNNEHTFKSKEHIIVIPLLCMNIFLGKRTISNKNFLFCRAITLCLWNTTLESRLVFPKQSWFTPWIQHNSHYWEATYHIRHFFSSWECDLTLWPIFTSDIMVDWFSPKNSKCQPVSKFWHLVLFWWDLLCNLTLRTFRGGPVKNIARIANAVQCHN